MSSDQTRAQPDGSLPATDQTAEFSTDTPQASQSPNTQSDTKSETRDGVTGAWDAQATRAESPENSNATANFTAGPVGRRASAVLQTSLGGYEIMGELGRGGMGVVYKAHQRGLNRTVALKMVLAGGHASEEQLKRFLAEARAVAHLQHPNIVQVFDIGENEGLPFFSLEFVDGEPLSRKLAKQPQPPKEAAAIMVVIAKAMQYAHDNKILHRDLKPANILLTSAGVPKIADFGLAKQIEDNDDGGATRTGTVIGTPSYMAPEQARGDTHVIGPATDQYALGAMLYEMLTGRPPFAAARQVDTILQVIKNEPIPPRQLEEKIPADLETICLKALQKDIGKRYENCGEFAADMERFLRGEPILARPVSNVERAIRWCSRNKLVASLSGAALLLLLTVAVGSSWAAITLGALNKSLGALNKDLEKQTKIAKDNEQKAITNEKEAKKQEGIAKTNEAEARKQEGIAKENEGKANSRAEELQRYIQGFMQQVQTIDDVESPHVRDTKNRLLDLALNSSAAVVEQLRSAKGEQAIPTKMAIEYRMLPAFRQQNKFDKATKTLEELLAQSEERVKLKGHSDASRNNLVLFLLAAAQHYRDYDRDLKKSLETAQRAQQIASEMLREPRADQLGQGKSTPYASKSLLAQTTVEVATTYYRIGSPSEAEKQFRETLRLINEVLATAEQDESFKKLQPAVQKQFIDEMKGFALRQSLAIGSALFRAGKNLEAEPYIDTAFKQAESNWSANPRSARSRSAYVGIAGMRAEFDAQLGNTERAMPLFEAVAKLADEALAFDPSGFDVRRNASVAYYRLGQWREELGDARSKEAIQKCLDIRKAMAAQDEKNERRKIELALALGRSGDFAKADEIAAELAKKENADSEMLLDLARGVAQASKHAPEDRKPEFLARAIDMVRRAKNQGFKDLVYLEKEIDFKPLWELPEFKAITAEIRAAQTAIDESAPPKVE